jgi:AraC-like DNA-binding protein
LQLDTFSCLQIRLSPDLAGGLFGGLVAELGEVVAFEDLWGPTAGHLIDQLDSAPDWPSRFRLFQDRLLSRLGAETTTNRRGGSARTWSAWHQIRQTRGRIRVDELASELDWSRKRLWSHFRAQVGLTPKQAAKLVRFDHAVHRLARGRPPAAVAADCGYSDQSHLHRDVLAFTGLTPAVVAAEPFLAVDHLAWGWPERRS